MSLGKLNTGPPSLHLGRSRKTSGGVRGWLGHSGQHGVGCTVCLYAIAFIEIEVLFEQLDVSQQIAIHSLRWPSGLRLVTGCAECTSYGADVLRVIGRVLADVCAKAES